MEIFCILYYVLSFCQSIPCVLKIIKTKSSNDYSLFNRLFQYMALICWTIYLISGINWDSNWYLAIIGIFDFSVLTLENILILLYYKWDKK